MGIYILLFLQKDKDGSCSKLGSGEGKEELRVEGGEEKNIVGQQTDIAVDCYWLCCWPWKYLVLLYCVRRVRGVYCQKSS